jgi:hypothetical protein
MSLLRDTIVRRIDHLRGDFIVALKFGNDPSRIIRLATGRVAILEIGSDAAYVLYQNDLRSKDAHELKIVLNKSISRIGWVPFASAGKALTWGAAYKHVDFARQGFKVRLVRVQNFSDSCRRLRQPIRPLELVASVLRQQVRLKSLKCVYVVLYCE